MKALILVMAIPIAILGNAVRIVATGVASQYNPALVRARRMKLSATSGGGRGAGLVGVHLMLQSFPKLGGP